MRTLFIAMAMAAGLACSAIASPTEGVTPTAIKIGTYTDLSGVTAMWGVNNSNAWRMVFDDVNKNGGINGRKIEYIVEDNQYQVPRSVQAENKLLNEDQVFIEVANGGTPMNNATMPMQLKAGVPNIFPLTSARSMYSPFNYLKFGLGSSYYDQIRAGLKYFKRTTDLSNPEDRLECGYARSGGKLRRSCRQDAGRCLQRFLLDGAHVVYPTE